jgi:predicted metalloprotease
MFDRAAIVAFEISGPTHPEHAVGLEKTLGQSSHRSRDPMPAYRHESRIPVTTGIEDSGFFEISNVGRIESRQGYLVSRLRSGYDSLIPLTDPSPSANREANTMRWKEGRRSDNVEDRRGITPAGIAIGGGIGTLILALAAIFLGADPRRVLNALQQQQQQAPAQQGDVPKNPAEEERIDFVKVVLADTEDVWTEQFRKMNREYVKPKLDIFARQAETACGFASAAVGPFYCPADSKVYIDLSFFNELEKKYQAPGDFAQAYVVAHEIGHHVQNLLGISNQVHDAQSRMSKEEANELSVRLELQADFLAGAWAHHAQKMRQILEPGDVETALRAATAIGDDRLQMEGQGYVVPDSFTHGTSKQRVRWFRKGLATGDIAQGDTFKAEDL